MRFRGTMTIFCYMMVVTPKQIYFCEDFHLLSLSFSVYEDPYQCYLSGTTTS